MKNSCSLKTTLPSSLKSLAHTLNVNDGVNKAKIIMMVFENPTEGIYNDEFIKYCKYVDYNIDDKNHKILKNNEDITYKAIKEFVNYKYPSVSFSTSYNKDKDNSFQYSSVESRIFFIQNTSVGAILDCYLEVKRSGKDVNSITADDYRKAVIQQIYRLIIRKVAKETGIDLNELHKTYIKTYDFSDEVFKNAIYDKYGNFKDNIYKDLFAFNTEVRNREDLSVFSEIFNLPILNLIHKENRDTTRFTDENLDSILDGTEFAENEDTNNESYEADNSIRELNNKMGTDGSVFDYIETDVKIYIASLKRYTHKRNPETGKEGEYLIDEATPSGGTALMDLDASMSLLYSYCDRYNSYEDFIKEIKRIAREIPGFEGFNEFANYIEKHESFGRKCYNTFNKPHIDRLQVNIDGLFPNTIISNQQSNREQCLTYQFRRDGFNTIPNMLNVDRYKQITNVIKSITKKFRETHKNKIDSAVALQDFYTGVNAIVEGLKHYFPSVNEESIVNYLQYHKKNNGNIDVANNFDSLTTILNNIHANANKYNKNLTLAHDEIAKYKKEHKGEIPDEKYKEYISKVNIADNYLSPVFTLVNCLLDYTPVKIEINGIGVNGKQNTNFINHNYLTNINKILSNEETALKWGRMKFKTGQYTYSNILFKKATDTTKQAIFLVSNKNGVEDIKFSTEGKEIFKAILFNGLLNKDYDSNANWHSMSDSDFINTAFTCYFQNYSNNNYLTGNKKTASYFLRTPSDATNQFLINAPFYKIYTRDSVSNDVNNLFNITNFSINVDDFITNNTLSTDDDKYKKFIKLKGVRRTYKAFRRDISNINITDPKSLNSDSISFSFDKIEDNIIRNEDGTVEIKFNFECVKDDVTYYFPYIMKGNLVQKDDNIYTLEQATFVGLLQNNEDSEYVSENNNKKYVTRVWSYNSLENTYNGEVRAIFALRDNLINNGLIKRTINRNHFVHKQFVNIFKQELLDAAINARRLFESATHSDNVVVVDENNLAYNSGFNNDNVYENYHKHTDKKGNITIVKNGSLAGNVFHSNHFNIYKRNAKGEIENVNIGDKLMQSLFNLLYGGADIDNHGIHIKINNDYKYVNENGEVVNEPKIELNLTKEEETAIAEMVDEYISTTVENEIEIINEHEDNIYYKYNTFENKAELILNYQLFYASCDEVFDGNSKLYKNAVDIFKREKEVQGSGLPFSNMDWSKGFCNVRHSVNPEQEFTCITIKNTVGTERMFTVGKQVDGSDMGRITKVLADEIYNSTGNEEFAKRQAKEMMAKFANAKMNDAQSYITYEAWKKRIRLKGEYDKYKDLIDKIENGSSLDANDLSAFIQVDKNFYFDVAYDDLHNTMVSRQIKNAEFVLVPRLIKGTELEVLSDLLLEHGIDQVNTEEATKVGKTNVLTFWDNEGKLTKENLKDFSTKVESSKQYFDYRFLHIQQDIKQHINKNNKAGIQFLKKIVDNVQTSTNPTLVNKYKEFMKLNSSNIKESANVFLANIGVGVDKNGDINFGFDGKSFKIKYTTFFDRFAEELARINQNSNMMECVTLDPTNMFDESGDTIIPKTVMPIFHNGVSNKLESVAQALFTNAITRQKLPGFHGPQITNIGFTNNLPYINNKTKERITVEQYKKLKESDKAKYTDTRVKYEEELEYHPEVHENINNLKDVITHTKYLQLSDEDKAKYKKETKIAHYIEIKLPKANFNFKLTDENGNKKTEEQLLKELQEEGLDYVIGYRIPTESKHSIAVMRVVGFLSDANGTTVAVPNAWVPQTGSDFDIDSIYGINFTTYVDSNGHIRKIKYYTDKTNENFLKSAYYRYVTTRNHESLKHITKDIQQEINDNDSTAGKEAQTYLQSLYDLAVGVIKDENGNIIGNQYSQMFDELDISFQDVKRQADINYAGTHQLQKRNNKRKYFIGLLNNAIREFSKAITEASNFNKNKTNYKIEDAKEYLNKMKEILAVIDGSAVSSDYYEKLVSIDNEYFKKLLDIEIKYAAKNSGLMSYEEFIEQDIEDINTRSAKINRIVELSMDIATDPSMFEETLSVNNFDAITDAVAEIRSNDSKIRKENRNSYRFTDQIANRSDAMSGVSLKALSVVYDNISSLCNNIRPVINENHKIKIYYNVNDVTEDMLTQFKTDGITIEKSDDGKYYIVTHNTLGWSNNNRNVEGFILTDYISKTSQHAFDAVKEGSVPNVNMFTFGVYKIFPMIGSNYKTAVSFIMQPGISEIVKVYESNNSKFNGNYSPNPITIAIKNIAQKLNIGFDQNFTTEEIFDKFVNNKDFYTAFKKLFNLPNDFVFDNSNEALSSLAINKDLYVKRLKNEKLLNTTVLSKETIDAIFDLGIVLQFSKIKKLSDEIAKIASVVNPDKFGAKQTLFATTDIFYKLIDLKANENSAISVYKPGTDVAIPFVEALYPGIKAFDDNNTMLENVLAFYKYKNNDDDYLPYSYLDSHLRYATASAILVNSRIFINQSPGFVEAIRNISTIFGQSKKLDEKLYSKYRDYVISAFYTKSTMMSNLIGYDVKTNKYVIITDDMTDIESREHEYRRVGGFGYSSMPTVTKETKNEKGDTVYVNVSFSVNDINNPTQEEIDNFISLTPAQKVLWIQMTFEDKGIFGYISPILNNVYEQNKGIYRHTLRYTDNSINQEYAFKLYNQAFYNSNPLIRLAAIDLAKYANIIEGGKMRKVGISKLISNSPLRTPVEENDIIAVTDEIINKLMIMNDSVEYNIDDIKDTFVRSNYLTISQIPTATNKFITSTKETDEDGRKYYAKTYEKSSRLGMYIFNLNDAKDRALAEKYNIIYGNKENTKINPYIKIKLSDGNDIILYKVNYNTDTNQVICYPLNRLDSFETTTDSSVFKNEFREPEFYEWYINEYNNKYEEQKAENSNREPRITINYTEIYNKYKPFNVVKPSTTENRPYINVFDGNSNAKISEETRDSIKEIGKKYKGFIENIDYYNSFDTVYSPYYISSLNLEQFFINKADIINSYTDSDNRTYYVRIHKVFDNNSKNRVKAELLNTISNHVKPTERFVSGEAALNNIYSIQRLTNEELIKLNIIPEENVMYSAIEESIEDEIIPDIANQEVSIETRLNNFVFDSLNHIMQTASIGDDIALRHSKSLYGITRNKLTEFYKENETKAFHVIDRYITDVINQLDRDLKAFYKVDDNTYLPADDKRTIQYLIDNPSEKQRFLKLILDTLLIIDKFKSVTDIDNNAVSEDNKSALENIKQQLKDFQSNSIYNNAIKVFVQEYFSKFSKDPRIISGMLAVYNGYYSSSIVEALFDDIQDTGNSMIQLITKICTDDLNSAILKGEDLKRKFIKNSNDIIERAKREGRTVDFGKIFNGDKFRTPYNEQFIKDQKAIYDRRRNAIDAVKKAEEEIKYAIKNGNVSPISNEELRKLWIERVKAEYETEVFNYTYLHQELPDEYYKSIIDAYIEITNPETGEKFWEALAEYRRLKERQKEIYNTKTNGIIKDELLDELTDVNAKLNIITGKWKDTTGELSNDVAYKTPNALNKFNNRISKIRSEYFDFDVYATYYKDKQYYENVIHEKEQLDADGNIINLTQLNNNEDYQKAVRWLKSNTVIQYGGHAQDVFDAFKTFGVDTNTNSSKSIIKGIALKHNAYDYKGVMNATLFTNEEIEEIRKAQEYEYNSFYGNHNSDMGLIRASRGTMIKFKDSFYKGMRFNIKHTTNKKYAELLEQINLILVSHLTSNNNTIDTVNTTELTAAEINKLKELYSNIKNEKHYTDVTKTEVQNLIKYLENNVEYTVDEETFNKDLALIEQRIKANKDDYDALTWLNVFTEISYKPDGTVNKHADGTYVRKPSSIAKQYLYGYPVPKGYQNMSDAEKNKWINKEYTEATFVINQYTSKRKTDYYYSAAKNARDEHRYSEWFKANHIYNPITHKLEPLRCWTKLEIGTRDDKGNFTPDENREPSHSQKDYRPKTINPNYNANGGNYANYRKNDTKYNSNLQLNVYEEEMKKLFEDNLREHIQSASAKRRMSKGYVPMRLADTRTKMQTIKDELSKITGIKYHITDLDETYAEADYGNDVVPNMPLYRNLKEVLYDNHKFVYPTRPGLNASPERIAKYEQELKEYNENVANYKKEVDTKYNEMINRDYVGIMADFIEAATKFNAIQKDKLLLYLGKKLLKDQRVYRTTEGTNKFRTKNGVYETKTDDNLIKQYNNWILRYIYNQTKDSNSVYNKIANIAQSITSAKFMWLNFRGAIANLNVGEESIISEAFAKEFFDKHEYHKANMDFLHDRGSVIADNYKDNSTSLTSAIIKFFKILDIDQYTGVVIVNDLNKKIDNARNALYFMHSSGEYLMQNTALLAMTRHCKVIINNDVKTNKTKRFTILTKEDLTNKVYEDTMIELCKSIDESTNSGILALYEKFKNHQTRNASPQIKKDYIWLRHNVVTLFLNTYMSLEQKQKFNEILKTKINDIEKDFNNTHESLLDQLELNEDGYLSLKKGSLLSEAIGSTEFNDDIYQLLGEFRNKVIGVNKKIHGYYDKFSAAQIERYNFGSLLMQYHKHLPMGLLKRFRRKGYFNEQRGAYEKGMYASLIDFIATPFRVEKLKKSLNKNVFTDDELNTIQHYQSTMAAAYDFYTHLMTNYHNLDSYDKANIRRLVTNFASVAIAAAIVVAGKLMLPDDDDDEMQNIMANLIIYESDRLASEVGMYSPFGIVTEAKTLWSNPIAVGSIVGDILQLSEFTVMSMTNPDFDWTYQNGIYKGENKAIVKLKHTIPLVYSYQSVKNLVRSNKYYRIGNTTLSFIPTDAIAEGIKDIIE